MPDPDEQAAEAARSLRALEGDSQDTAEDLGGGGDKPGCGRHDAGRQGGEATPAACSGADAAASRHIQTEQRRRNRINDGYAALRSLLPSTDRTDKATFLTQVVEYVRAVQGVLRQLTEAGTVSNLPVDLHWSIRTLLPPRPAAAAGCPTQPIQAAQAAPAPALPPAAASAASTHAPAVPAPTGAAACAQLSGLGFSNLLAQQAAVAQLQVLQQLVAQAAAGLPTQPTQALQVPAGVPALGTGAAAAPDILAMVARQLLAASEVAPRSGTPAAASPAPADAPAPEAAPAAPACTVHSGASAESRSSQNEGCLHGEAPKPARKGVKRRRHTTAARFVHPPSPLSTGANPGLDGLAGRPAAGT